MKQNISFKFGGPLTKALKIIIIANIAVYFLQILIPIFLEINLNNIFGISKAGISAGFYWQFLTYGFLHGSPLHLLLNMFALWIFAGELENFWGTRRFIFYYLMTTVGAGIFIHLMNFFSPHIDPFTPTIGASGAIFGILLAFGVTWPNREVLLYFIIPIKMKYFVLIFGLIEFFGTIQSFSITAGNISHIGHLGGIITGIAIIAAFRFRFPKDFFNKRKSKQKLKIITSQNKAKETIDRLLDKIAREGMSSLTSDERKELEWARKNYYPDPNEKFH
ncbi:MAG TPA: rhomboid family intramembrane serine protease [Spirochaetota bacterium]|nr:rhomboid family intramembrane serine protease [Spirochaetota bacterium]HQE58320.1 rhomboid family intramembrane serine protease [Spirochaetota bacterium]